jgi:hypothetical protein
MRPVASLRLRLSLNAGCATGPSAIAPIGFGSAFPATGRARANAMLAGARQPPRALSTAQENAVTGDAVGVFLRGVPASSVS